MFVSTICNDFALRAIHVVHDLRTRTSNKLPRGHGQQKTRNAVKNESHYANILPGSAAIHVVNDLFTHTSNKYLAVMGSRTL